MRTSNVCYDGTLRVVMWLDAFWSMVAGLAWLVLLPAVALLDFGPTALTVAAVVSIAGAIFLGACGAVTFVLLTLRMRNGHYYLPPDLRLPLPRVLRAWSNVGGPAMMESMYVPRFNALDDADEIRALVRRVGAGDLVTVGPDAYPLATRLPLVWEDDRLVMHLARANPHWRAIPADADVPALVVVTDAEAYVSPSWYATKAEHGRVVPTWNYSAVHITGRVRRHEDSEWLRRAVTVLTDQAESTRPEPWAVTDAPATYVDKQLRAIVGLELVVERVEGKAKLSQNRSEEDRAGVVAGLRAEGGARESVVAGQMARATPRAASDRGATRPR